MTTSSFELNTEEDLSGLENSDMEDNVESDTDNDENNNTVLDEIITTGDNVRNDMLDDVGDDESDCDIEDTKHFSGLYDTFQQATTTTDLSQSHPDDDFLIGNVRSAMDSGDNSSSNSKLPLPTFGDSLDSYFSTAPLIQTAISSTPYYFSYDPTTDPLSPKLYVGNLPLDTTEEQLREYFDKRGYSVKHIALICKRETYRPGFAFIRFNSTQIATSVLSEFSKNHLAFYFRGIFLRIGHPKASNTIPTKQVNTETYIKKFNIAQVHYGTLITRAAMKNIYQADKNIIDTNHFGLIAHPLVKHGYRVFSQFGIDEKKKKFAIIIRNNSNYNHMIASGINVDVLFEWNFRDLRGDKINPIVVMNNYEIYLLMEIKRPPTILRRGSSITENDNDENRLPGTPLIGHANVWLFKLDYRSYRELFWILRRNNLSPRHISDQNILTLIYPIATAIVTLKTVIVLPNDRWMNVNQDLVNDFYHRRWPSYPFETKFEIMKLISKHIITFHDLIVDETAEIILKQCSINTLIACTDKILEHAPRWLSATCDIDEEDEYQGHEKDKQDEEAEMDESTVFVQEIPTMDSEQSPTTEFYSSTGATVILSNDEQIEITTDMTKLSHLAQEHHLGIFSRLLLFALTDLIKKHQLRRLIPSGMYITKHEARTSKAAPFLIRKIYITPSTIFYEGPYREEKCATTRRFEKQQDRFLRVSFRDEDYRVLHNYNNNMAIIYNRINEILKNGLALCDRKYEFLAFSSSQLREHSCWMFATTNNDGIIADTIRTWMRDFRKARPVAKFAARLGQSFSTSIKGIKLEKSEFRQISDVTRKDEKSNNLCFTDGIGIITPSFAKKLMAEVNPSSTIACPSAFQIRCGGFKGMLCLDVNNTIPSGNIGVYFRDSMKKFDANEFSIDVIRTSANPSVAYLNRQIIHLLSSLGISDQVFLSLQDGMLQRLRELTGEPRKACEALKELNEFGGNGCHSFLIDYLKTLGTQKDPFARRILIAFRAFLVKELRTKAKVLVPNSWSLFGVVDETKQLQYGQVFIQIDGNNQQKGSPEVLQGPVIVTRSPCFHPGDIRRLEAVDIPALHDLKNVIVFPMNGPRPHPLEMSGGDLDGDTFWISNHKQLIFNSNEEPFDYQDQTVEAERQAQLEGDNPFTIEDVCNFFVEYIKADNLGIIAHSHLAFADQLEGGATNEKCLALARMHSTAVDFAKNGVKAPRLTRDFRCQGYPHYMEKKDKPSYKSKTILGKLYDEILQYDIGLNINIKEEILATFNFPYKSFTINGYETYMQDANSRKNEYDRELRRIMRQYGIKHEVELISGYILKFISKQYANETKLFDLRNEISHAYRVIRDKYLRDFWKEFYVSTEETSTWTDISKKLTWKNQLDLWEFHNQAELSDEIKQKASAWFNATYDPWIKYINQNDKIIKSHPHTYNQQAGIVLQPFKGLFSFAWLIYPVLFQIFNEHNENSKDDKPPASEKRKAKQTRRTTKKRRHHHNK